MSLYTGNCDDVNIMNLFNNYRFAMKKYYSYNK